MTNYAVESREWWVERWLELLDSYRFKKRLERARRYASEGNVESITFKGAKVLAKVKGSEPKPYQVSLSLSPFSDEDWNYTIATMSEKAIYSAKLLAGIMPANIEDVFTANGLSLFPFTLADIHSNCSCPDKANPCKHIGAVYYQLGDRFSEDPFVLFQLRGRTKEQILEALRQRRSKGAKGSNKRSSKQKNITKGKSLKSRKPKLNLADFWRYDEPLASSLVAIAPSLDQTTILELLGSFPLATAEAQLVRYYLEQGYQMASQQAAIAALNRSES